MTSGFGIENIDMTKIFKKIYSSPKLTSVSLDKEITLVMASGIPTPDPEDPYDPEGAPAAPSSYPFGSSTPDYSGMSKK